MPSVPGPIKASIGLAVTLLEEARKVPDKAIELPVLAVSSVLQLGLRAQQRYTSLIGKGDEVLMGLRGAPDEPPTWATFDDEAPSPVTRLRRAASPAPRGTRDEGLRILDQ